MSLSRRNLGKLVLAGVGGGLSLGSCGRPSASPATPLRIMAVNHVWPRAINKRIGEFEQRISRRVSMSLLTADQLANSYNVKLNASATDIDVMMVRALQEQLLFARNGWLADLTGLVNDPAYQWDDFQDAPRQRSNTAGKVLSVPVVTERPALYYRKDLTEPPATLDALRTVRSGSRKTASSATSAEANERARSASGQVSSTRSAATSLWMASPPSPHPMRSPRTSTTANCWDEPGRRVPQT